MAQEAGKNRPIEKGRPRGQAASDARAMESPGLRQYRTGDRTLKMAEGAVCCEPVSAPISLLTREYTGILAKLDHISVLCALTGPVSTKGYELNSLNEGTGNSEPEAGNLWWNQGTTAGSNRGTQPPTVDTSTHPNLTELVQIVGSIRD